MQTVVASAPCRACGHPVDWHHHLRPGFDCSRCGCERSAGRPRRHSVLVALIASLVTPR